MGVLEPLPVDVAGCGLGSFGESLEARPAGEGKSEVASSSKSRLREERAGVKDDRRRTVAGPVDGGSADDRGMVKGVVDAGVKVGSIRWEASWLLLRGCCWRGSILGVKSVSELKSNGGASPWANWLSLLNGRKGCSINTTQSVGGWKRR